VWPNWDNTPRSGRLGRVALHATPERFGAHVRRALQLASNAPLDEQLVMVKSWNEWAEGNYLEPDTEFGLARLQALAREVRLAQRGTSDAPVPTKSPG
jgi:lipopolysaccharide biosynthesis protein